MHEQSISFRTKHCAAHKRNDDCARKCEFGWEWNGPTGDTGYAAAATIGESWIGTSDKLITPCVDIKD